MGLLDNFLRYLQLEDVEHYDYENEDWRTFRPDESIWTKEKKVDVHYVRRLTAAYNSLIEEVRETFPLGPKELVERFNNMHGELCELKAELAYANAKNKQNKHYIQKSQEHQTSTGTQNEIKEYVGLEVEEKKEQTKVNNKFVSNNGQSGTENLRTAAIMSVYGFTAQQIAEKLRIEVTTIPSYLSRAKKHYMLVDNRKLLFDDEYGGDLVDPEELFGSEEEGYEEEYEEETGPSALSTASMGASGVIARFLKKPYIAGQ